MKLFESITIQFVTINNIPIENLIVSITVLANKKNDYSLGFFKTDSDGKLIVFRSMIENEIEKAMTEYIMDYASNINDCKDWLIIEVENISGLETRLKNIEKYYSENAEKLSRLMNTCSNKLYKTLNVEHKIESNTKITVQNI